MSQQSFDTSIIDTLARDLERLVDSENSTALLGRDLSTLAARIPSEEQVTLSAVIRLALMNDVLRIAERALLADGQITAEEIEYVEPLVREALKYLGRFRNVYKDAYDADSQGALQFLQQHANDRQMFGGKCSSTQWIGVSICKKAEQLSGDGRFADAYRTLALRALDDLFDGARSGPMSSKAAIVAELLSVLPAKPPRLDAREAAYCSADSPEVFHAIAHEADVFEYDPFDVDTIHASARQAFARLLSRSGQTKAGRMLLVNGESGSGKTHLMRAFRHVAHGEQLGVVTYMQMSTQVTNYARYILSNTISSWEHPFWGTAIADSALTCVSESVARDLPLDDQDALQDDSLSDTELDAIVNRGADRLLGSGKYNPVHVDVVRMMLYLRRRDPARRSRVIKFLRCESLSPHDRSLVGGVAAFEGEEGPARMLSELGRLVAVTGNGAMIVLVDQVEDMFHLPDDGAPRFRLAMDALRHVTDHVPTSVVVIACLEDYYIKMRGALSKPVLDRLERDPEPVRLTSGRTLAEIEEMLERRLGQLFDHKLVAVREDEPRYPFRHDQLVARTHQRTRDVLDWARRHHEASIHAGHITEPLEATISTPPDATTTNLAQKWNDHRAAAAAPPDDEATRLRLLSSCLQRVGRELEPAGAIRATADGGFVDVQFGCFTSMVAICNKGAQGGGLAKQVEALLEQASGKRAVPIVLRGTEYPPPGESKVARTLKAVLQSGGRKLVISDTDWRSLHALSTFETASSTDPSYAQWLKTERPLSNVPVIRAALGLDEFPPAPRNVSANAAPEVPAAVTRTAVPSIATSEPARRSTQSEAAAFGIGETRGLVPQKVTVSPASFVTHAAFLGSSGSGKTTLALRILEELASRRVPVLMLDRKGDLCRYGSRDFWNKPEADPSIAEAKRALSERLDVRVYTPGEPRGRALKLAVVPSGLQDLPTHERGMVARYAASALGAMMGYRKSSKSDETRLGILGKAIELVGRLPATSELGIAQLVSVLDDEDPDLVSSVGKLDTKHFRALVENLETLRLRYEHVLRGDGERLSPELLFGLDDVSRTKTRVTIISTKSLGDNAAIDFWVARLLGDLSRWASQHPSGSLQAVVFLDEADLYLPAQSKPATKEPMLDLLKRARSAGLGVFLATQSPGDLDYRCRDNIRTWFVGRIAEKTAVDKMKPLLSECRTNIVSKLGSAKIGEFFKLQDGDVVEFKAMQSIMKTEQVPEDEILRIARSDRTAN